MGIVVQFGGVGIVAAMEHTSGSKMRLGLGRLQGGGGCNFACLPEQIKVVGVEFVLEEAYMKNHDTVASRFESLDQNHQL